MAHAAPPELRLWCAVGACAEISAALGRRAGRARSKKQGSKMREASCGQTRGKWRANGVRSKFRTTTSPKRANACRNFALTPFAYAAARQTFQRKRSCMTTSPKLGGPRGTAQNTRYALRSCSHIILEGYSAIRTKKSAPKQPNSPFTTDFQAPNARETPPGNHFDSFLYTNKPVGL